MEREYELLKKYANMMASQDYPVGEAAMLMLETEEGVFATKYGADLSDLKYDQVEKLNIKKLPMSDSGMKAMVYSQTPYCQKCLKDARAFKPSLDDMAQIIGPAAYIADGRDSNKSVGKSLKKALSKNAGCFVLRSIEAKGEGSGYTVTVGRSLFEAVVAMTVLEKSAETTILADKIGGAKNINPIETRLMRKIYKKKYSKAEEIAKITEAYTGITDGTETYQGDDDRVCQAWQEQTDKSCDSRKSREQILREKLVDYGKKLVDCGLVQGTWGNLSIRLDENNMLVTPSGLDYMRLTPEDMVKVHINTLEYEGDLKPTSEKGLHAEIYKRRTDVNSVIHTHSKYACVFAAAEKSMPVEDSEMQKIFSNEIKLAGYALPGTKKLMINTANALGNNFACIMSHHGMVACGHDIETAFDNCVKVEDCGKQYLK